MTRTSSVPYSGRGQASQWRRVVSSRLAACQSSQLRSTGGVPPVGISSRIWERIDRQPLSSPSQYGEFADAARSPGSRGTTPSKTRRQVSGSGTET